MRLVVFQLPTSRSLVSRVGLQVSRLDCRQGSSGPEGGDAGVPPRLPKPCVKVQ